MRVPFRTVTGLALLLPLALATRPAQAQARIDDALVSGFVSDAANGFAVRFRAFASGGANFGTGKIYAGFNNLGVAENRALDLGGASDWGITAIPFRLTWNAASRTATVSTERYGTHSFSAVGATAITDFGVLRVRIAGQTADPTTVTFTSFLAGGVSLADTPEFFAVSSADDFSIAGTIGVGAGASNESPAVNFEFGNAAVVPEPSTYALLATGLAGLGAVARRRRVRA